MTGLHNDIPQKSAAWQGYCVPNVWRQLRYVEGHMRFISSATVALAMACTCASVYAGDTILLTRPVNAVSNGILAPAGTGLFTVNDHGENLQQITPFVAG